MGLNKTVIAAILASMGGSGGSAASFDPLESSKLAAFYTAHDSASFTATQWLDKSANAKHGTRVGAVSYDAANAVAGGRPAVVWPSSHTVDCGILLPGMTVQEAIIVMAYTTGVENVTAAAVPACVLSGISGSTGSPVILFNSSGNAIYTTAGATRYDPEPRPNGADVAANTAVTPLPYKVQNFRMSAPLTETTWKLGYKDDAAPTQSWRGPIGLVMLFNAPLTDEERYQYYGYINTLMSKSIPIPSWVMERGPVIAYADTSDATRVGVPYFASLVDTRAFPGMPYDFAAYASTDHSASAGIYAWGCNGDPFLAASWTALGRVYEDLTSGTSTETPDCRIIDGVMHMFYQQSSPTGGYNQHTLLATSTDGVNFTRQGIRVIYPVGTAVGDGHTGYFKWGPNPMPTVINPATGQPWRFLGYGLAGGTVAGTMAQWGCDDLTQQWTKITSLHLTRGRACKGYAVTSYGSIALAWNTIDMTSVRPDPATGGYRVIMTLDPRVAGAGDRISETYEVLLGPNGVDVLARPLKIYARNTTVGAYDEYEAFSFESVQYGGKYNFVFNTVASAASGLGSSLSAARASLRSTDITVFPPLSPVIPASLTTLSVDFKQPGATLPAWLEFLQIGTTAPTLTIDTNGASFAGTNVGAIPGEAYLHLASSIIPNNASMIEFIIEGESTPSTTKTRIPLVGFGSSKSVANSMTDMIYTSNDLAVSGNMFKRQKLAGVEQTAVTSLYYYALGYGTTAATQATAPKTLGYRWFPATGELFQIGEGMQEYDTQAISASTDKTIGYYPFFGVQFKGADVVERITKITVRYG